MNQSEPIFTPRSEFSEAGSEGAFAGWTKKNFICIGTNVVYRAARTRPERERRAILWLANLAARERLPADWFTEQLGISRPEVRAALTDPDAEIKHLLPKIESLRALAESKVRAPADTALHRLVSKACRFAMKSGALVEVIAKTRNGKTESADYVHQMNLDRTAYFSAPSTESYSDFIYALGRAMGLNVGSAKTVTQIEAQIRAMFGKDALDLLIIDEGHYLWPTDITKKPRRVEFVRSLWDENKRNVGIAVLSTPQSLLSANLATAASVRWAPGQWEGRVQRYQSEDTVSDADMAAVARWHAPEANDAIISQLVLFGRITAGFLGSMINSLERARSDATDEDKKLTLAHVRDAQRQMIKGTTLEKELAEAGVKL